jgi:serine phosphatase RsbU (regulator of sigma subunit)
MLGVGLDVTERRREHATVETLQRSLLPRELPAVPGIELAACYRPAAAGSGVGGDFYDVFPVGDSTWCLMIGDVAGKGPEAAALSALARYTVRADAQREPEPRRLLGLLNEALVREGQRYCTAACASLELHEGVGALTVATAGHPPPLLVRDGSTRTLTEPGDLLGFLPTVSLQQRRELLEPGDMVVFYTDGVTDAQAPERLLDASEIGELLASWSGDSAAEVASRLERAALPSGASGRDDIAILVMRMTSG